jgi:hypothetical protein
LPNNWEKDENLMSGFLGSRKMMLGQGALAPRRAVEAVVVTAWYGYKTIKAGPEVQARPAAARVPRTEQARRLFL